MKKYLITGSSGFVSWHLLKYLNKIDAGVKVLGLDSQPNFYNNKFENINYSHEVVNLINKDTIKELICDFNPNFVIHLASYSSVAYSWENPVTSFANNTNIFLNLLEVIRECRIKCRILSVGSSEQYGNVDSSMIPILEKTPMNPISPYAVARVAQELLSKIYVESFGMDIVITRSFNHIGPGQKDSFVIPSFIKRIKDCLQPHSKDITIKVGDLRIIRDFTDVRDVVKAYILLLTKGHTGEIYNVCSGVGYTLDQILGILSQLLDVNINTVINDKYIRPNDNQVIIGSRDKIFSHIGWKPKYLIKQSLKDMLLSASITRTI